jgi:hypothetical protein
MGTRPWSAVHIQCVGDSSNAAPAFRSRLHCRRTDVRLVRAGRSGAGRARLYDARAQLGTPQIPGLGIVYLTPLGDPAAAPWQNIILHQTEGPAGSARGMALAQSKHPARRGVTLWVETDGTVYWATPETAITTHGDGANRNDNKYVDNSSTYRRVTRANSIGIEFVGNFPDVRTPPTSEQFAAGVTLVRFLQERYGIPASASMPTTGSTTKTPAIARAARWLRRRVRKVMCRGAQNQLRPPALTA